MIPDKIQKAYYSIREVAEIMNISRWKTVQIINIMEDHGILRSGKNRYGRKRFTEKQLNQILNN